ncbi:MAG: hypothetical protein FRX48_09697 [Lasallia pustulata]|uniref:Trypsin-like cysteine/serine peptidase domain n=1 Tax=Lasallia pustulata TaxID=136370 RepID=A0A5M8PCN7_9LECA|nr:MAG: hypothetical protein FRX48_09697 [Lasallia pustulata]
MESYRVLKFSPSRTKTSSAVFSPQRLKQPSSEKRCLPYTTVFLSPKRAALGVTETGSSIKKLKIEDGQERCLDDQFNVKLDQASQDLQKSLAQSKRIELPYSLFEAGRATAPPKGDFSDLFKLFPTTFGADVFPPYLIIRVRDIPPKPWPLTIGGLPVQFSTDKWVGSFDRGQLGRGHKVLEDLDLQEGRDYNQTVLRRAVKVFQELKIKIRDIFWFGGFWQITIPDGTDIKLLPSRIASNPSFYRTISQVPEPDPAALRNKPPQGIEYDDTLYTTAPNALLRPGIMLSSSVRTIIRNGESEEYFKTTTSGILVTNQKGELFITVATHGFEDDGLVYHPNPHKGTVIGRVIENLPGTDISIARLNSGLRYVNETFGTYAEPDGVRMNGISPAYPPHLRVYDALSMNNPFSGSCEGVTMALGAIIAGEGDKGYVAHEWSFFENGDEPVDGSCGSPILDVEGKVVGLFRFKAADSSLCLSVSAMELREFGYDICSGEQSFT